VGAALAAEHHLVHDLPGVSVNKPVTASDRVKIQIMT
jgi:hypothetical protein